MIGFYHVLTLDNQFTNKANHLTKKIQWVREDVCNDTSGFGNKSRYSDELIKAWETNERMNELLLNLIDEKPIRILLQGAVVT